MPPLKSLMAPRARKLLNPQTPEPFARGDARGDAQPPPPPRPRFRLRRRIAPQREAPTQQFLASVAAADVPIPSIEEPRLVADEDMLATPEPIFARFDPHLLGLPHGGLDDGAALPKTPVPCVVPAPRFPDWSVDQAYSSLDSSPECSSSRPSTAQSTQTSASLFSRHSINSDVFSQFSLDADDFGAALSTDDPDKMVKANPNPVARRPPRAPWTRSMTQHLWTIYTTYLQDPHVTPFHLSKAGLPPQGVCMRVAREAKRSWRGSKPPTRGVDNKSASATPTANGNGKGRGRGRTCFVQWPHSCAATRAHLRDLCKVNAGSAARSHPHLAPFSRAGGRSRHRRSTPLLSPKAFSGSDMALSLALSTCESMQPLGPLAQLTASEPEPAAAEEPAAPRTLLEPVITALVSEEPVARLGSPFTAKSYGPSSSRPIKDMLGVARQSQTVEARRGLRSPAKLNSSRSSTHKRRSRPPVLEPRRKRPSLSSETWTAPPAEPPAEYSSTASDTLFVPRTNIQELISSAPRQDTDLASPAAPVGIPRRLGSPFAAVRSSFSLPSRGSSIVPGLDFGAIRRPFATQRPDAHVTTTPTKPSSLRSRLAYIDERLRDFRRRDHSRRRSRSPM